MPYVVNQTEGASSLTRKRPTIKVLEIAKFKSRKEWSVRKNQREGEVVYKTHEKVRKSTR